jgi:type IV pilus assembly protein PilW
MKTKYVKTGRHQTGVTLMEIMIGLALSLVVTTSMVVLMSNSLGTTTRVIQMTQLSDELRNSISMMTRDLRRANYSANAAYCYANSDCGVDGAANQTALLVPSDQCMSFNLDRNQDGDASTDDAGAFRRNEDGGVGFLEMWVGGSGEGEDPCGLGGSWLRLTDPNIVDIDVFAITLVNLQDSLAEDGGATLTQNTREVNIQIGGRLRIDENDSSRPEIRREIEDTIRVRNDFLVRTGP